MVVKKCIKAIWWLKHEHQHVQKETCVRQPVTLHYRRWRDVSFPKPSWWHRDQIWNTQAISFSSTSSSSTTFCPPTRKCQVTWAEWRPPVRWTNLDLWKKIVLLKLIETVPGIFLSRKPFLCSFTCSVHPQKHTPKRAWRFVLGPWRYNIHIRLEM